MTDSENTFHNSSIRSDEGLTLETSAFESLYGGQFTLSTQLMKPNYLVQDDDHFKYGGHKCAEYQHKNFAPEKRKASWLFFFLCICVGGIGKLFKPKTRSFCLTLSSQLVFKYHLYFTAVYSNLENFFKTPFPYAV